MKEMLKYLKPYRSRLLLATALVVVSTVCELLLPAIMSDILNQGIHNADFTYILSCCIRMLAVSLVSLTTVLWGSWVSCRVVAGFCRDVRSDVFRKVNAMSFEEFGELGTSALVTRATHDVQTVSWIASELCGTVITIPVLFFGAGNVEGCGLGADTTGFCANCFCGGYRDRQKDHALMGKVR